MKILFESVGYIEMPQDEFKAFIATKSANEISKSDYVDSATGEIMWEKGKLALDSEYHPSFVSKRNQLKIQRDAEFELEELEFDSEYQLNNIHPILVMIQTLLLPLKMLLPTWQKGSFQNTQIGKSGLMILE